MTLGFGGLFLAPGDVAHVRSSWVAAAVLQLCISAMVLSSMIALSC